jgi:RNA polymerase sigma-70 factor (ECF subfamily)
LKTVLFACIHNAGRSQMAAALFNAAADPSKARAISAGTEPGPRVHPEGGRRDARAWHRPLGREAHAAARGAWKELDAKLRPFVARRVRSPADVDDVVQDVFLRIQRGASTLRDSDRFGPWVYRIARTAIVDQQRTAARNPLAERVPPEEGAVTEDDASAEEDLAAYVAVFVAMLPSPYREALTLTELEGMSQKDAAAMLGISVSGMKSRVQRGREQLREALEACCNIALDARGHVVSCEPRPDGQLPDCRCR